MRWIEALKVWNRTKKDVNPDHLWCTPRKGTPEHAQVKEIMARAKPAAVEERNKTRRAEAVEKLEKVAKAFAMLRKAQAEKREEEDQRPRIAPRTAPAEPRVAPAPVKVRGAGKLNRDQLILGLAEKGMSTRKIVSELAKIGMEVAQRTVVNVIQRAKGKDE